MEVFRLQKDKYATLRGVDYSESGGTEGLERQSFAVPRTTGADARQVYRYWSHLWAEHKPALRDDETERLAQRWGAMGRAVQHAPANKRFSLNLQLWKTVQAMAVWLRVRTESVPAFEGVYNYLKGTGQALTRGGFKLGSILFWLKFAGIAMVVTTVIPPFFEWMAERAKTRRKQLNG